MDIVHSPALRPFLRAGPEPLDITETLTLLPPIQLLSLENDSDAMDVDLEHNFQPGPIVEIYGPRPDDFVVPCPIDPYTECRFNYPGHALYPEGSTSAEFETDNREHSTIPSLTPSTLEGDQHESHYPSTLFEPVDLQSRVDLDDFTGDQTEILEGRNVEQLTDDFGLLQIEDPPSPKVDRFSDESAVIQDLFFANLWSIPSPPPSPLVSYTDLMVEYKARLKAESEAKKLIPVVDETPAAIPVFPCLDDLTISDLDHPSTKLTRTESPCVPRTPPATPPRSRASYLYSRPPTEYPQRHYRERVHPALSTGWASQSADKEAQIRSYLKNLPPQTSSYYWGPPFPMPMAQPKSSPPPREKMVKVDDEPVFPGAYPTREVENAAYPLYSKNVEPFSWIVVLLFGYVGAGYFFG